MVFNFKGIKVDVIYLGNPWLFKNSKVKTFGFCKEKVETKLMGSQGTLLSQAVRLPWLKQSLTLFLYILCLQILFLCLYVVNWTVWQKNF